MATTVTPIISEALEFAAGTDNLINQNLPGIDVIDVSTFRRGDARNVFSFKTVGATTCKLGIFACSNGSSERSVILVLPQSGVVDRIVIGISHGFGQNAHIYGPLGWANARSRPMIQRVLLNHVINRWGPQVLAGKSQTGLFHIIRGAGTELGPFASNAAFTRECLEKIAELTEMSFSFDHVEAFTFSSGIYDFNAFLGAAAGHLNIEAVYNIDPSHGTSCTAPRGATRKQFLSGTTTQARPAGFEFLYMDRWHNESAFGTIRDRFSYLHNRCMPFYALHLGLQL